MRIVRHFTPDPAAQLRALRALLRESRQVSELDDERAEDRPGPDPVESRTQPDDLNMA